MRTGFEFVVAVVDSDGSHAVTVFIEELLHSFLYLLRRTREKEWVAVVNQLFSARRENVPQQRLSRGDIGGVLRKRDLVDVEVRERMITEIRSGIQPEI